MVLKQMDFYGHQQIMFIRDEKTGLRGIIAVHDTTLGPALGGTRMWNYGSEDDALYDVLRLSQGMTMKNAAAGLALGGGKAVIIGDAKTMKTPALLEAYAKFVDSLGGIYNTAEDMNINSNDIDYMSKFTKHVVGTSAVSSDPSPFTAKGVFNGMRAGMVSRYGSDSFKGKTIAVQGLGSVGYDLCGLLHKAGASLIVFDIDEQKTRKAVTEFGARAVSKDEILTVKCDILSPCAMGAVLNENNTDLLKCDMVAGSANNILATPEVGMALLKRDILYLPDYIINAGGVINCGAELMGSYNVDYINTKVEQIFDTTRSILDKASKEKIPTNIAADSFVRNIIDQAKKNKK